MAKRTFYGWWVAWSGFLALVVVMGLVNGTFAVFFEFLEEGEGWSRGWISTGFAAYVATAGLISPLIGWLIDRFGARAVMAAGSVVVAACLVVLSQMRDLQHFILTMVALGVGTTAVSFIPVQKLVATWFVAARGTAMGLAMAGGPLGAAVTPYLARWMFPEIGWRASYAVYGLALVLLLAPLILFVIRNRPSDLGLLPDGTATEAATPAAGESEAEAPAGALSLKRALLSPTFIFFCFVGLLTALGSGAPPLHFFVFARDRGFDLTSAATVISIFSVASVLGSLLFGWLAGLLDKRITIALVNILAAASIGAMLIPWQPWLLFAAVGLFGICWGALFVVWPMLLSEVFGVRIFAALMGVITVPITLGWAAAPILAGIDHDVNGNYLLSFGGLALLIAAAGVLIASVRPLPEAAELDCGDL